MANNLFIQYLNFITDNTLSPSDYLFKEANLKKINNFISQKLYEQNEQEEFISGVYGYRQRKPNFPHRMYHISRPYI